MQAEGPGGSFCVRKRRLPFEKDTPDREDVGI
jgi:hypothetical protein